MYLCIVMLGQVSAIKTRNQVKDIPVHKERFFICPLFIIFHINILRYFKD